MKKSSVCRRATVVLPLLLLASALPSSTLTAQLSAQMAVRRDTIARYADAPLFTSGDAALAAGFVGLTVAMFPLDKTIARRLAHDTLQYPGRNTSATDIEYLAVPGVLILAPALYAYGRFGHHPVVEDVGLHTTEALVLATGITSVLKGVLGRSRPYVTHDSLPNDFHFGKGFSGEDNASFPSTHTAVAFAAASSLTSELAREWPGHTWFVAPVTYGTATLVGLARMYTDKHWASDVAFGAGFGVFSGLKVVRYAHAHPDNYVDRVLLHTTLAPDGRGATLVGWTTAAPR